MSEMTDNKEIEKLLKDKMNGLAESVDCFDKISSQVFPKKSSVFSEDDYSVSRVENITGKSKVQGIIKWAALTAAAVCFIAVIPKTSFCQNIFSNLQTDSREFDALVAEINKETEDGNYSVTDIPLEEYCSGYFINTPFFQCPFEKKIIEDINVRIFTFQINDIETNQIFAVEYKGEYSADNIIAVADSGIRFTDDDIEKAENFSDEDFYIQEFSAEAANLSDENNYNIGYKSFRYLSFVKSDSDIMPVVSEIIYGNDEDSKEYYYDIISVCLGQEIEYSGEWSKSVYYNGKSALPEESHIQKSEIFLPYAEYEIPTETELEASTYYIDYDYSAS